MVCKCSEFDQSKKSVAQLRFETHCFSVLCSEILEALLFPNISHYIHILYCLEQWLSIAVMKFLRNL